MAVQSVDRVQRQSVVQQTEALQLQQRLNLFSASSFERVDAVAFTDGSRVDIPAMGQSDRELATQLFGDVAADKQAGLDRASDNLGQAIYAEIQNNPAGIKTGSFSAGLNDAITQAQESFAAGTGNSESDTQIQGLMFMSMIGIERELADFAAVVKAKVELAGEVRADVSELQTMISEWPDDVATQTFTWTEVTTDEAGNLVVTEHTKELSKEDAEKLLPQLEQQLTTLREMNELDRFDLQRMTQDYQQALNVLTAMLKQMHDTQKAIIANAKA